MNNSKKNMTTSDSMDIINTAILDTGGKRGSGLKRSEKFPPHIVHFWFFFFHRSESQ